MGVRCETCGRSLKNPQALSQHVKTHEGGEAERGAEPGAEPMLGLGWDGELAELRHQREKALLKKQIADLEAAQARLPERVAALERSLKELEDDVIVLFRALLVPK